LNALQRHFKNSPYYLRRFFISKPVAVTAELVSIW
jgi:hypothetical protein